MKTNGLQRIFISFLLITFFIVTCFGQSQVDEELIMTKYRQLKLRVTPSTNYSNEKDDSYRDTSRNWKAFAGNQPINEVRFFEIVGDKHKAEKCREKNDKSGDSIGIGLIMTVFGILFALIGLVMNSGDEFEADDGPDRRPGTVVAVLGAGAAGIGMGMASTEFKKPTCNYTFQEAQAAAAEYNEKLLLKLMRQYQSKSEEKSSSQENDGFKMGDTLKVRKINLDYEPVLEIIR